jgi:Arc/MetJ-type ribon-helix-helix transcriptional regulator
MAASLNISLAEGQLVWLKTKQRADGFASASDVVRDLIRREQEYERQALLEEFRTLEAEGNPGVEPIAEINRIVSRVKRERRETARRS